MKPSVIFFPVDNGDMTLIKLSDKTTILTDINLREAAENEDNPAFDAAAALKDHLETDEKKRPYVDVFLLSHPDQDHCRGLKKYFHLGPLSEYNDDPPEEDGLKIVIREIWSSPIIFRRAGKTHTLCEDAKAFSAEAKRRVNIFRNNGTTQEGDRILIIGEDENGKTEGLETILVKIDDIFSKINGKNSNEISMRVLGPIPIQEDIEKEEKLGKNHSSVILQYTFSIDGQEDACLFLSGGDAEVYIWEQVWELNKGNTSAIQYDLLMTPHHCSWHSISYDSWSKDENPKPSQDALSALSQAREGAFIISSSKPIKNDKNDPPCWGAKAEYLSILKSVGGEFFCTGEHPDKEATEPLKFTISAEGPQAPAKKSAAMSGAVIGARRSREPLYHG
jgi:hypothetical protein